VFVTLIIPALALVSKIHVPAVGVAVKNPIAFEIPNSPVVFGDISHVPVIDLNCIYSGVAGVRDNPLLTHSVFTRSYLNISPFERVPKFTSVSAARLVTPPDSLAATKFVPLYFNIWFNVAGVERSTSLKSFNAIGNNAYKLFISPYAVPRSVYS